jgi:hypothetical protein
MRIQFLTNSWQRSCGAMFRKTLGDSVFLFVYPTPAMRLFHTFFCPPLRIMAIAGGVVMDDLVVTQPRFVSLPICDVVVEASPETTLPPVENLYFLARSQIGPNILMGGWDSSVSVDRLVFALLADATADLRRVFEANHRSTRVIPEEFRKRFSTYERGRFATAAGFLLDFIPEYNLPRGAVCLSRQILQAEHPYLDELFAASVAGMPWQHCFPNICIRCGKPADWKFALQAPETLSPESTWRYSRPENGVPLCRRCTDHLDWYRNPALRIQFTWGVWGPRFDAFQRWHRAVVEEALPVEWNRQEFPLWPFGFGGPDWATGSGALKDCDPRPPIGIALTIEHRQAVTQAMGVMRGKGRPATSPFGKWVEL